MNLLERMLFCENSMVKITKEQIKKALEPTEKQKQLLTKLGYSYKGLDRYDCIKLIDKALTEQRMISGLTPTYFDDVGDELDELEGWFKMSDFL